MGSAPCQVRFAVNQRSGDAPRAVGASDPLSPLPSGIPSGLPSSLRIEDSFWRKPLQIEFLCAADNGTLSDEYSSSAGKKIRFGVPCLYPKGALIDLFSLLGLPTDAYTQYEKGNK